MSRCFEKIYAKDPVMMKSHAKKLYREFCKVVFEILDKEAEMAADGSKQCYRTVRRKLIERL